MTSLEYTEAVSISKEGFAIFPVHTARATPDGPLCTCGNLGCTGKHPRGAFSEISTTNREQIDRWFNHNREPAPGIGIHLGKSYCWVLDIDGEEGQQELAEILSKHGSLPDTRTIVSGSGDGFHYYFAGWVDKIRSGSISENIHIKGNAGHAYVVAPPTLHVSGNRYTYLTRTKPVDAPDWLLSLIQNKSTRPTCNITQEQLLLRASSEVPITRILTKEHLQKLHDEGNTIRGSHPTHGSKTNRNFCIDKETNRWFCNREGHQSSGGLFELAAMLSGICKCEDFRRQQADAILIPPLQGKKFTQAVQFCLDFGIDAEDLKRHISRGKYNEK